MQVYTKYICVRMFCAKSPEQLKCNSNILSYFVESACILASRSSGFLAPDIHFRMHKRFRRRSLPGSEVRSKVVCAVRARIAERRRYSGFAFSNVSLPVPSLLLLFLARAYIAAVVHAADALRAVQPTKVRHQRACASWKSR